MVENNNICGREFKTIDKEYILNCYQKQLIDDKYFILIDNKKIVDNEKCSVINEHKNNKDNFIIGNGSAFGSPFEYNKDNFKIIFNQYFFIAPWTYTYYNSNSLETATHIGVYNFVNSIGNNTICIMKTDEDIYTYLRTFFNLKTVIRDFEVKFNIVYSLYTNYNEKVYSYSSREASKYFFLQKISKEKIDDYMNKFNIKKWYFYDPISSKFNCKNYGNVLFFNKDKTKVAKIYFNYYTDEYFKWANDNGTSNHLKGDFYIQVTFYDLEEKQKYYKNVFFKNKNELKLGQLYAGNNKITVDKYDYKGNKLSTFTSRNLLGVDNLFGQPLWT